MQAMPTQATSHQPRPSRTSSLHRTGRHTRTPGATRPASRSTSRRLPVLATHYPISSRSTRPRPISPSRASLRTWARVLRLRARRIIHLSNKYTSRCPALPSPRPRAQARQCRTLGRSGSPIRYASCSSRMSCLQCRPSMDRPRPVGQPCTAGPTLRQQAACPARARQTRTCSPRHRA